MKKQLIAWLAPSRWSVWLLGICSLAILTSCGTGTITRIPRFAASYQGTVRNITSGIQSPVALSLKQQQTHISGDIIFGFPLVGSGPFQGTMTGDTTLTFRVTSDDLNKPVFIFTGQSSDGFKTIHGTYSVDNGDTGTWSVEQNTLTP